MKSLITPLSAALLIIVLHATSLFASIIPHPAEPDAVYQGSFTIDITISSTSEVRCDVCTWRVSGGGIEFTIDESSIRMNGGSGSGIDTYLLFDLIARAAVERGIALGYLSCGGSCLEGTGTKVYHASCVERTGAGIDTRFIPCGAVPVGYRSYSVCCPVGEGSPIITTRSISGVQCAGGSSGCRSTCHANDTSIID